MGKESRADGRKPHRVRLGRQRVVEAAISLADSAGISGASMRAVAASLGVEPMSLYNHVTNREDLLDGMIDAVFGEIEVPGGSSSWREEMRKRAVSTHATLRRHPWAIGLMDSRNVPGPSTLRHHDAVIGTLRRGGFSVAMAIHAVSTVDSYVYGNLLQERSLPLGDEKTPRDLAADLIENLSAVDYPYLAEIAMARASDVSPGSQVDTEFSFGLTLILDAIKPDTP